LVGLPVSFAVAKEVRFKDYPIDVREGDRVTIQNFRGTVKLVSIASGKPALIHARKSINDEATAEDQAIFEALSFAVQRPVAGRLDISVGAAPDKGAWMRWVKQGVIDFHLEIEMPSAPIEVTVRDGQVLLHGQGWRHGATVSLVSGKLQSVAGEGSLKVQVQRGEIQINGHKGPIDIDAYAAKVVVSDVEGEMRLANFSGDSKLVKVKGRADLISHAGATSISGSSGALDFINGRGAFTIAGFQGAVKGQTDQGAVSALIEGEADVQIESNQASVTVKPPSDSGAALRLRTDEGTISLPAPLTSTGKVYSGKLSGPGGKGSIAIKSKSGPLRIRF
jgi:hypothetical protein